MRRILTIFVVGIILICIFFKDAQADTTFIPDGQGLEAQAERFRQEYSVEKRTQDKEKTKPSVEFKDKEEEVAPGVSFVLKEIHLTGTTIFDPSKLNFTWNPYLEKKVNFKDINVIVRMIKRVYKDLGYLTTTAYLPPQDVKNGVVEIRVVEGKRGNLNVEGNKWFSTSSIAKYFHTFRGQSLDTGEIEKDVMRLNDNRDLNVNAILSPGKQPEIVDVTLKVKESYPHHVSVSTDNQGTRLTGRYRRSVIFNSSNLTGRHDNLSVNATFSTFSSGEYVSYQTPLGINGTKVGVDLGYFEARLGEEFRASDITTTTKFYTPHVSWELYLSQQTQVNLRSGIKIKDIRKRERTAKITDERLRVPFVGIDVVKSDKWGQTTFSPEVNMGTEKFLGSSFHNNPLASRVGAGGYFLKYAQYLSRTQRMPLGSYLQIRSQLQTASRTLPSSEQLQLGGMNSVRGYPSGDYLADIGANMNTEWVFPSYFIPSSWKIMDTSVRSQVEPFVFFDMGGGKLIKASNGERRSKFLSSIGGGIKIHLKDNLYLKLEWGLPVGDKRIRGTGPSTFDVSFQAGT